MSSEQQFAAKRKPYELPKVEKMDQRETVISQFKRVNFDIEKCPELFERIVELANMPNSHFDDAVKMADIVDLMWDDLQKDGKITLSKEQMMLACLFHDIGKSGPPDATPSQRFLIEIIYNPVYFKTNSAKFKKSGKFNDKTDAERQSLIRNLSIQQIIEIEKLPNEQAIFDYLQTLEIHSPEYDMKSGKLVATNIEDLDIANHSMLQLWREHDVWTYLLLNKYQDIIPEDVINVASSHHLLEDRDPAKLINDIPEGAFALEVFDKYIMITLFDKYQAFIDRSGKDHLGAIKEIERIITQSKKSPELKARFNYYVDKLRDRPDIYAKVIANNKKRE